MNPNTEPVILANSKFSIDLLKVLCRGNTDNVLFSPLSISSALGLILLGAGYNSSTANQMSEALHFGNMRIMYHYLYEEIYKEGEYKNLEPKPKPKQEEGHEWKRSLQLVNRFFGEKTVEFKDDFLDYCEEWCFASLRSADFKNNPEAAREKINSWVQNKISDKMNDMLDKGDVSKDTSLALISAVYFKKKWVSSFSPFVTKKGKRANWPMMGKTDKLPLGTIPHRQHGTENTVAQILEIPYENNELQIQKLVDPYENNHLSMIMILPNESDGLLKMVESITYEQIMEWTQPDNMILTDVNVEMPIFTLQEKYDLETALKALGITDLFSDKCDLSGMAPGKLKLSKMVHKCVVEVNEEGTDAEGGGGGGVDQTDGNKVSNESFIADRPFLFFIRHNPTKSIVFWGRVMSPRHL